jgi:tRNA threonylcarbamoyladenosine biosynthesis protein TsaE
MYLADASDTESLGARLGAALRENAGAAVPEGRIHLCGPLGAGKTTLVRGLARALGIEGPVKSPTYTLLEPYTHGEIKLYHFDLYRLSDGEELEYLGARDVFAECAVVVIEWPERAGDWLPAPDLKMDLRIAGRGREAHLSPASARGEALVAILSGGRAL